MKKTKIILKRDILKALKTEILKRGSWFHRNLQGILSENCKVCAVGAVLRKVSFEKWARKCHQLDRLGLAAVRDDYECSSISSKEDIDLCLSKKNYLGALSGYFESGHNKEQCIKFVKNNFPVKFRLTIRL